MTHGRSVHYATRVDETLLPSKGLKSRLRSRLRHSFLSARGSITSVKQPRFLRLLYCHFVFDDQVDQFRTLIRSLTGWGTFVDTDTCISMLEGNTPIDARYFHLSFDDGFRNVIRNAVPVLEEFNVPSIFFVPTLLIGSDWETTRQFCLETTSYGAVIEFATWEDLRSARLKGVEIGSHTRTHARFSDLISESELSDEIAESKRDIESQIQMECNYIAWPFGRREDTNPQSLNAVRTSGYKACFGAFRGSITPGVEVDPFYVPRHHFEVSWPLSHIRYFAAGHMEG